MRRWQGVEKSSGIAKWLLASFQHAAQKLASFLNFSPASGEIRVRAQAVENAFFNSLLGAHRAVSLFLGNTHFDTCCADCVWAAPASSRRNSGRTSAAKRRMFLSAISAGIPPSLKIAAKCLALNVSLSARRRRRHVSGLPYISAAVGLSSITSG